MPKVQEFESFAAERGASKFEFGDAGLHNPAAHMPKSTWDRLVKHQHLKDLELVAKREALKIEYDLAVEKGEVRPPTAQERLEVTANGDPDSPKTIAARNVLIKRLERINYQKD